MKRKIEKTEKIDCLLSPKLAGTTFSGAVLAALAAVVLFSIITGATGLKSDSDVYLYLSYLLPSLVAAAITLIVLKATRTEFAVIVGFFKFNFKKRYIAVILLTITGMLFGLGELNNQFVKFLNIFGYVESPSYLPDYSVLNLILTIFVIAVVPPVVEETIFRGIIQSGLKKSGYISVILTAATFALYHLSPAKTIYQFVVGLLFSLIYLKSGSIIPAMIVHFLNNLLIILSIYFNIFAFVESYKVITTVFGLLCVIGALVIVFTDKTEVERSMDKTDWLAFLINASAGFFLGTLIWIITVFVH